MSVSAKTSEIHAPAASTRFSRRGFFKRFTAYIAIPAAGGLYATQVEPFWPEFHEIVIPVPGLPRSFDQYRIAHLTDLHAGRVPFHYLRKVVDRVKDLQPDLVAVTGDLVHHNPDWVPAITQLLGSFAQPVLVSFGNHDYAPDRGPDEPSDPNLPEKLRAALAANGCQLLCNSSTTIDHPDGRLWFVGLDDLWFGDFNAHQAFVGVPRDQAVIALSHNPDTADQLDPHSPNLILSGHTHGGQIRLPLIGALYLNTYNTQWDQGRFTLKHSTLYVSRGIGYIRRIRFCCRPEVPIFRLVRA